MKSFVNISQQTSANTYCLFSVFCQMTHSWHNPPFLKQKTFHECDASYGVGTKYPISTKNLLFRMIQIFMFIVVLESYNKRRVSIIKSKVLQESIDNNVITTKSSAPTKVEMISCTSRQIDVSINTMKNR